MMKRNVFSKGYRTHDRCVVSVRVAAKAPTSSHDPVMRPLSKDDTARTVMAQPRVQDISTQRSDASKGKDELVAGEVIVRDKKSMDHNTGAMVVAGGRNSEPKQNGVHINGNGRFVPMVYKGQKLTSNTVGVNSDRDMVRHGNGTFTEKHARSVSLMPTSSPNGKQPRQALKAKDSKMLLNSKQMAPNFLGGMESSGFSRTMMVAGFQEETDAGNISNVQYDWESYSKTKRTIDTWSFVLLLRSRLWLLDQKWSYPGGFSEEARSRRARSLAIWIRETLLQLGPTFIKIGQLFSTRSDLFPGEFVEELSKLQDRVPAFPSERAIALIEKELGAPLNELFAEFDPKPIAAASLGQVHLAKLNSGEQVVVKVQRPGLKRLFDIDLENLRVVAEQLDKGDDGAGVRDFKGIYEECATILYQEIDYINEGRNADLFRRNFRPQDWVRVPRVHWQRTTGSILTMEYVPGIKITNVDAIQAAGLDAPALARRSTEAYLIQILKHGFFHADPHPGNIAVDYSGRLIFYDFGMMGSIVNATRERLLDLFYAIAKKDVDVLLLNLTELGIIAPTSGDTISIRRALAYFVDNIGRQAEQQETVAAIGEDLFAIALDSPFRFPATFTFVLRAFATLEGIGKALDPTFSFAVTAAPYAQELLDLKDGRAQSTFLLGQLQTQAVEIGTAAAAVPMRVERIERTIASLEAGDIKLRVRVLEGERAARRAGIMQSATLSAIGSVGLLNVGVQLALGGQQSFGGISMLSSGILAVLMLLSLRRVRRLDKFEDGLKGRGKFPSN